MNPEPSASPDSAPPQPIEGRPAVTADPRREGPPSSPPEPARVVPASRLMAGLAAALIGLTALAAAAVAWTSIQRVRLLEQQLVARQQQSQTEATEAVVLARQSQDSAREVAAKMALLEARVSEVAVQRSQLDELIQSLTRSRDENLLADLEAALRVAQQQAALTGSPEPVISTLRQAEERLARYNQPRLERVRRAVLRDLERAQSVVQVDISSLVIRIDEVVRQVDDLPLAGVPATVPAMAPAAAPAQVLVPAPLSAASGASAPTAAAKAVAHPVAPSPAAPPAESAGWRHWVEQTAHWASRALDRTWGEVRSLVRLSRVDNPESVLASPDQVFFLRENLKLRLLNARLSLLSRQFDVAQSDLRDAQRVLDRYFDAGHRRVGAAKGLLQQVGQQARLVVPPRPEETLAALASTNAGR